MKKLSIDIMTMGGGKILSFLAVPFQSYIPARHEAGLSLDNGSTPFTDVRKEYRTVHRLPFGTAV